jgi:hypothetical protein
MSMPKMSMPWSGWHNLWLSVVKALNKKHTDKAKERRKEMAANAETRAKAILEEDEHPFLVEVLDVGANPKVG